MTRCISLGIYPKVRETALVSKRSESVYSSSGIVLASLGPLLANS